MAATAARAGSSRIVSVACTQMSCTDDAAANISKAVGLVRDAAAKGANIILLQELFAGRYWCQEQKMQHFSMAQEYKECAMLDEMSKLAKELKVVLPVSFFEEANNAYFNSVCMIDADGRHLGVYRKTHIPDGPGYQEKFYFSPGDTGFKVFSTMYGKVGCAICWDQWFPESARAMALMGAEILFYPTAIGSEPQDPSLDSKDHWQRVMCGHAGANLMPVVASNRVGKESWNGPPASFITFYGASFIADNKGKILEDMGQTEEGVRVVSFDLDKLKAERAGWGVFRDRRPEHYRPIVTLDGRVAGAGSNSGECDVTASPRSSSASSSWLPPVR